LCFGGHAHGYASVFSFLREFVTLAPDFAAGFLVEVDRLIAFFTAGFAFFSPEFADSSATFFSRALI
jgi:hypothetical protein